MMFRETPICYVIMLKETLEGAMRQRPRRRSERQAANRPATAKDRRFEWSVKLYRKST